MKWFHLLAVSMTVAVSAFSGNTLADEKLGSSATDFTGEILPVFYVRDLQTSVSYYEKLGFRFDHYFDHHTGESVSEWKYKDKPTYAEMWAGNHMFALHLASSPDSLTVGGMRHYFGVHDVDTHYALLKKNGINVGEMTERPWMRMFTVTDPDGHVFYFQTRLE